MRSAPASRSAALARSDVFVVTPSATSTTSPSHQIQTGSFLFLSSVEKYFHLISSFLRGEEAG